MRSILVLPPVLALLACQPQPADPPTIEPSTDEPMTDKPDKPDKPNEPVADEPATADSNAVVLTPFEQKVSVAVGTSLRYSFKSHGSVGYGANQACSDEAVVRYVRTDTVYEQSEAERAGKTGADAATGTFVFEAVAPGTATVTIDEVFRGTTEQSYTFTIVVSE